FIHQKFIPFKAMRKTWQYQVLTRFKAELSENKAVSEFVDLIFKEYPNGFYVHLPKESRITNKQKIAKYVARYIRHPAVADSRICGYDGDSVTFWYKDHEYLKHFVTMKVQEFIKALIQHIPDRNFKMIRHYGAYARRIKKRYSGYLQRSIKQTTFSNFHRKAKKWAPECPFCGASMKFYLYVWGPPKDVTEVDRKITDWCGVNAQP
ncbi:MAG: transposase, partial [Methanosarcinaceae archaeon]